MISESMVSVDYYDLYMHDIKGIEVKFYGDDGELPTVTQGRSFLKLHLRRRLRNAVFN